VDDADGRVVTDYLKSLRAGSGRTDGRGSARIGRAQVECAAGILAVGGVDVDLDVVLESVADDQHLVEAHPTDAADQRSIWAFAFGACTGVRMTLVFSPAKGATYATLGFTLTRPVHAGIYAPVSGGLLLPEGVDNRFGRVKIVLE
jgi:hypothetical protein